MSRILLPMTEREAFRQAFGPDPQPECDGAGRDIYAVLTRTSGLLRRGTCPECGGMSGHHEPGCFLAGGRSAR